METQTPNKLLEYKTPTKQEQKQQEKKALLRLEYVNNIKAGVENRPTGLCILKDMKTETSLVYKNEEILKRIEESKPKIVAIDAPLSLPSGREFIEQRTNIHLRECDKELLRRGIKFFPITLGPMRKLTSRGTSLKRILEIKRFRVIEVYPGGAQDILGIPRKQHGLGRLRAGLGKAGVRGLDNRMSDHELNRGHLRYCRKTLVGRKKRYLRNFRTGDSNA